MKKGEKVDIKVLKELILPSPLTAENFQELAGKAVVDEVQAGESIFSKGEIDRETIFLLDGDIILNDAENEPLVLRSGSEQAKKAIANAQPRAFSAKAKTLCKITRIDSDLLDILTTWDQVSGIEVEELTVSSSSTNTNSEDEDWMTAILREKAFYNLPPVNIQSMFMKMEEYPVKKGDVVIKQGDEGDFYYIIRSGVAKVSRSTKNGEVIVLAELKVGNAFGEEALVSNVKRNASVTMECDGLLMRLSASDFNILLKEPRIDWVTKSEAEELCYHGGRYIDVRLEEEVAGNEIEGAIKMPLFMIRLESRSLDDKKKYVAVCDTGRKSSIAAFLLKERGFDVCVLKDGLLGSKS